MSFYGNQYLEFQKFFYRLLCKSSGVEDTTFPKKGEYLTSTLEQSIEPQSTHDKFILDTANRWIRMVPHKAEDGSVNGIQFFHAEAAGADGKNISLDTFTLNEKSSNDETQLEFGDSVIAHTLEFDEAGHINKTASHNYKMPAVTIAVGKEGDKSNPKSGLFKFIPKDEWITLTSKDDSIIVGHKDAEDLEAGSILGWENFGLNKPNGQINNVDTGSYFAVPQFTYDDRGHITNVTKEYYKLPTVDVEDATQDLQNRMATIENTVNNIQGPDIATLETNVENLQEYDKQLKSDLGNISDLNNKFNSITEAIGDTSLYCEALKNILDEDITIQRSLSSALTKIIEHFKKALQDEREIVRGRLSYIETYLNGKDSNFKLPADR